MEPWWWLWRLHSPASNPDLERIYPMSTSSNARVYSPYQEAIFRALTEGEGNILVEAVAGSGKTTTMVEALRRWQLVPANRGKRALFCAFNKSIADELSRRVPAGVDAKTLHSLCFGAVMRRFRGIKVDDHKLSDTARAVAQASLGQRETERVATAAADLAKVYGLLRGTLTNLTDSDAIQETVASYGASLDAPTDSLPLLNELDQVMKSDIGRCTFGEMLTLAVDHSIPLPRYDLVCIDESQDLNRLQIEILKRALAPGGRLVAVGDSYQSLYLFQGSDAHAMDRIRVEFNVSQGNRLPLSVTYRCPRAVVALAQRWVPHIQAADGASEGEVIERTGKDFALTLKDLEPDAMIICRVNAPLVGVALRLIAMGKKASVRGRDIGKNVSKLATKLSRGLEDDEVAVFAEQVATYGDRESAKLTKARKVNQAQQVQDLCETLWALLDGVATLSSLQHRIDTLFSDDRAGIMCSSIHKAKGTEANTVVWLAPEKNDDMEERARSEGARIQELNSRYVASTRAIKVLIIQPLPPKKDED